MQPVKDCIFYIFQGRKKEFYAQFLPHGTREALRSTTFWPYPLLELDGGDGLFTGNYRGEPYAYETVPEEEEEEELPAA